MAFPELAANIRKNVDWAKKVGGEPFDPDLLLALVIELEKKIGGRRPELPPPPVDPLLPLQALPPAHNTKAQLRTKKRLVIEIREAERARRSKNEQTRRNSEEQIKVLQMQLNDLRFDIAISGLAPFRQKMLCAELGSPTERKAKAAAYRNIVHTNDMMDRLENASRDLHSSTMAQFASNGLFQSTAACFPATRASIEALLKLAREQNQLEIDHPPTLLDVGDN